MIITQENIIKQVSSNEDIDVATVRQIFKMAENIIFDYLSSTAPTEKMLIKPFNGMNIERKYIDKKIYTKGMFKDLDCPSHIKIKAGVSKYYNNRVNDKLFEEHRL